MALSMGTIEHEEMGSRSDQTQVYDLGKSADSSRHHFPLLRLFCFWMGRLILAGRDSHGLHAARSVPREQPPSSQTRTSRRHRLEPKHLVARPTASHGLG